MGQREIAIRREAATPDLKIAKEGGLLFERIFKTDPGITIASSSPKIFSAIHPDDFTENFYLSEIELKSYIKGFVKAVKEFGKETAEKTAKNSSEILDDTALDDKDVKLSLYRSFKSLYDKWIVSSNKGDENKGYFFNNYGQTDDRFLFDHFKFINRTGVEIGGKAAIDPAYLSTLADSDNGSGGPKQSLYQVVTGLLNENNFNFLPLPSFITVSEKEDSEIKDMFRAFDGPLNNIAANPKFVCMYIGGNSRTLDIPRSRCGNKNLIDFDYKNDSFDINDPTSYPSDFSDTEGIVAFKVRYGQEAQNHFTKVDVNQTEFKETQESLLVIDALANPRQGNSPATAGKGNNIYDMYLTRGYTCTVESLGNSSIQPLMYFKLENVPMFRGTYLITDVKHTVTPHNVKTEFTGTRQPIITTPVVEDPISLLDLALSNESVEGPPGTLGIDGNSLWGDGSTPPDIDTTVYGDTSNEQCPQGIEDGGVAETYINGKKYLSRLCKVAGTNGKKALVSVKMALNLQNMIKKAEQDGVKLTLGSHFRTMEEQYSIAKRYGCYKNGVFKSKREGGCRVATAKPGFSNHQTGTAIDFGCNGVTICYYNDSAWCAKNGPTKRPEEYKCFKWMVENANNYGYYNWPEEAWHWSVNGK